MKTFLEIIHYLQSILAPLEQGVGRPLEDVSNERGQRLVKYSQKFKLAKAANQKNEILLISFLPSVDLIKIEPRCL